MNVYDFDGTLYKGDSTRDFCFFCLKRNKSLLKYLPKIAGSFIKYSFKQITKTQFKERLYSFFNDIKDIDEEVKLFWETHEKNIKSWCADLLKSGGLVISASPEFLLEPITRKLNFALIASRVDMCTGKTKGENCWGEEKVRRFHEIYPNAHITNFFSDSLSDTPLAKMADTAYIIKGEHVIPWQEYTAK